MPLPYEPVSLTGGDKHAVIIDIGVAFTKVGFAGESAPRCIIRTRVTHPTTKEKIFLYQLGDKSLLFDALSGFVHELYFRHLLVAPKDRCVVIVESVLGATYIREALAKVLFEQYEVFSICFAPCHLMPLFTLARQTAIVIDCGYRETTVIPICQGIPYLSAWQALPLGAAAVHKNLETLILELCKIRTTEEDEYPITDSIKTVDEVVLEDIKVKSCFVTTQDRAKQISEARLEFGSLSRAPADKLPSALPTFYYHCGGDKRIAISSLVREYALEIYFEQNNEQTSIATIILDSLLLCPIDLRKTLSENIILTGGGCMLSGFKHRLQQEGTIIATQSERYSSKLASNLFKFHNFPAKENYVAWLGASIFGELEVLPMRSLSRERYNEMKHVPDWCDIPIGLAGA